MRKINGITINGEYLGNSVVINGMFRAICTISPIIMRDFVLIINQIERLDEAVKIKNFNCGFDCIDIEFNNSNTKGIASLYFKLINGEPELTDCKLIINDEEYVASEERIAEEVSKEAEKIIPETEDVDKDDIVRKEKINEIKSKKLEELRAKKEALLNKKNSKNINKMSIPAQKDEPPKSRLEKLLEQKRKIADAKAGRKRDDENSKTETISQGSSIEKTEKTDKNDNKSVSSDTDKTGMSVSISAENITENITKNDKSNDIRSDSQVGSVSEIKNDGETAQEISKQDDITSQSLGETESTDSTYTKSNELKSSKFDNLDEIDLENLSDEELAELEAELEAQMVDEDEYNSEPANTNYQGFNPDFAENLSQGLINGLTQGLSEGLAQGIAQGLSQGFAQMSSHLENSFGSNNGYQNNQNFDSGFNNFNSNNMQNMQSMPANNFDMSNGFDFSNNSQPINSAIPASTPTPANNQMYQSSSPDYAQIDNRNYNASMEARDNYAYDENSNLDDLSELYSDFYEECQTDDDEYGSDINSKRPQSKGPNTSEIDALKAELEALRAEAEVKKDLMTLDEFLAKQKELEEAKEKKRRQKFRIVGSRERVNASALDGGVFVAGNKVYKWGDTKVLE